MARPTKFEDNLLLHECPEFLAAFRYYREEGSWSNVDLANELAVAPNTIGKWLNGANYPTAAYIRRLCEILDVRLDIFWRTGCEIVERERSLRFHREAEPTKIAETLKSYDERTIRRVLEVLTELYDGEKP